MLLINSAVIFAKYIERNTMFCTKMSKLWVAVVIFAIPIIAQESAENYDKFGFTENIDRLKCKNGTPVVLEKEELLYQEYVKCIKNTVDLKQMNQDIRFLVRTIILALKFNSTLSELQSSPLRLYSLSYCPKFTALINCEATYSSIDVDCLTAAEAQAKNIKRDTIHRLVDYFCNNNAEEIIKFFNGKFFECGMAKQYEMRGCVKTLFSTMRTVADSAPLTTNIYCKSIDDFFNCTTSIFQQCLLSQSPVTLMESLHSYIKENGICSTAGDAMNLKMSLL